MPRSVIADAGLLVGYLVESDEHHAWARTQFERFAHFNTCEAVISEACARLNYYELRQTLVVDLLREGVVRLDFNLRVATDRVGALMEKYADQPMDLADGCLVAMSEAERDCLIVTTDGDFKVYRRFGREVIPTLRPD